MRILITGSNGLLGQKLVQLLSKKPEVTLLATARGENRLPQKEGYEYASMDIADKKQVKAVFNDFKPATVIHTAAMTHVDECHQNREACWQLNVKAVGYLLKASQPFNSHFIHLSTDFIFDGADGPYDEAAEAAPVNYYGESKLASEALVMDSGLPYAILRTVLVYGIAHDMSRSNIILWVKNSLENKKNIQVVTDQWRTPTLAEDLAEGCYLAAKHQANGVYNISGKDMLTPYEMAVKTAGFFELDAGFMSQADSSSFSQPAKRPAKTGFIIEKAQKELGYSPKSFEEGIAEVARQLARRS